ncbi:MAG: hypothetical protein PUF81_04275 [Lachnospiraceae bacterium]|nr:hypothetical protein [Agathobacter sp.]MDD6445042.1 hypothetical protein [Lachnospiraceae bacterium]
MMWNQDAGILLGECDLIMSFLCYNDISAMSRLHRSTSAQIIPNTQKVWRASFI